MADANGNSVRQRKKPPSSTPTAQASDVKQPAQNQPPPFQLHASIAFSILFASHIVAAVYHPIQDCDEVFNFWEPSHYLNHGHGFQTWEYSPVYAIRSWTYAGLHSTITLLGRYIPLFSGKAAEFYTLRVVLGLVCALCEARLFSKIAATLNPRIAVTFLFIMATSPGMFHASISYLPSSFAMYTTMLGMAAFMDWRGGLRTAQGIFAIGAGAVLGWPFAAAMALPFLLEEVLLASVSDRQGMIDLVWRLLDGTIRVLLVLAVQVAIDSFFFKKLVIVPFNIIWYNIFSSHGGPDLYGTEPWPFYFRNLILNFHFWLPFALLSMPLVLLQHYSRARSVTKTSHLRGLIFLSPFYLWLTIFTLQPHKEERFMYPVYPALALNAAVALHVVLANISSSNPKNLIAKIPLQLRLLAILTFMLACLILSIFRVAGTMTAYSAPLHIYDPLHRPGMVHAGDTVCLGKEWYRFPSHYLLPSNITAKFIKSEFSGLLPGEFSKAGAAGLGFYPGASLVPSGMNDQNREDPGKYTDLRHCNLLVDLHMSSTHTTKLEPNYIGDMDHWEYIKCLPFLDATSTGTLGRLGWVPNLPLVPAKFKRVWGEYCLLRRRKKTVEVVGEGRRDPVPHIETLG